jgi:phosphoglycerate kinase
VTTSVIKLEELEVSQKRVLVREDLNVPLANGKITSDVRIRAALPTLEYLLEQNARLMVMSHLGRPEEGVPIDRQPQFSLEPVAERLSELLGRNVPLVTDWLDGGEWERQDIVLLENVRVFSGEKSDNIDLAEKMAALCDVFVMDAFATAHRAQASTHGVAQHAPVACAGPLLCAELEALERALSDPSRPVLAIVGGSKVSGKLNVLDVISSKVEKLIVGGGIANTFLAAAGYEVGASLYEEDLLETARSLMDRVSISLPQDVVVAGEISSTAVATVKAVGEVKKNEMIVDVGPATSAQFADDVGGARTIIWNGPVGVFEHDQFGAGTRALSKAIAESSAFSLAGGGDTLAAIDKYGVKEDISYISTGGGAFLEFVEGKILPAVAVLQQRYTQ